MHTPSTSPRSDVVPLDNPIIESRRSASRAPTQTLVTRQIVLVSDSDFQVITDAFCREPAAPPRPRRAEPAPVDQAGFLLGGVRLS